MQAKTWVQIMGAIICLAGLILIVYSETFRGRYLTTYPGQPPLYEMIIVYPYQIVGAIVLLIGAVAIVMGFAIPGTEEGVADWDHHPDFCCGKCTLFGTEKCETKEQYYNKAPCPKFFSHRRADNTSSH